MHVTKCYIISAVIIYLFLVNYAERGATYIHIITCPNEYIRKYGHTYIQQTF